MNDDTNQRAREIGIETCPACGALPCDWVDNPFKAAGSRAQDIARAVERMREHPFADDAHLLGTTQQDARMEHYATIAITSAREEALREAAERITAFQALIARDSEFYEGGFSALNDALEIIKDVRDGLSLITGGGGRG